MKGVGRMSKEGEMLRKGMGRGGEEEQGRGKGRRDDKKGKG